MQTKLKSSEKQSQTSRIYSKARKHYLRQILKERNAEEEITKYQQKIHAFKANEARKRQILAGEEERQWADREYSTPRMYPATRQTVMTTIMGMGYIIKQELMALRP